MRKGEIIKLMVWLLLLSGCNEKKPQTATGESQSKEERNIIVSDVNESVKGGKRSTRPEFKLREIPVEQKDIDTPEHISEVNSDIQKIIRSSANPEQEIWNKYYIMAMTERESTEVVPVGALWEQLSKKPGSEKLPAHFYREEGGNMKLQKGLYGLYLASFISSSKGGGQLFDFIQERATDKTIKQIDLNLCKVVISGMIDAEGRLDKMTFEQWEKLSQLPNSVYRMLAVQVGNRLFEKNKLSTENYDGLNRRRLKYYECFLNDDAQKIRLEALKGIRNLGNELALPILEMYRKGEYGETDRVEVDSVFGK